MRNANLKPGQLNKESHSDRTSDAEYFSGITSVKDFDKPEVKAVVVKKFDNNLFRNLICFQKMYS